MRYVKSLDGLRGVAVFLVVLYHYEWLACGWLGVQIFFVLSGYLITNILVHQKSQPLGVYLKRFYWRRVLRIFPLYYTYLVLATITYFTLGEPDVLARIWKYLYTYTNNIATVFTGEPGGMAFGHFWSLAVEEQFYLLWPALVFLLPTRAFRTLIVALILLGPALRWGAGFWGERYLENPYFARYVVNLLPTSHLDAFAWGGSVAVFRYSRITDPKRFFRWALAGALLFGVGIWLWRLSQDRASIWTCFGHPVTPFADYQHLWGYSLINGVSALAVLAAVRGASPAKFLDNRFVVRLGRISYGVYVFHYPILRAVVGMLGPNLATPLGALAFVFYFSAVVVVAEASFRLLESPLLALKNRLGGDPAGAAAGS